jgi:hypothetical protein
LKNIGSASIGVARKRPKGQKETRNKETKETIGAFYRTPIILNFEFLIFNF